MAVADERSHSAIERRHVWPSTAIPSPVAACGRKDILWRIYRGISEHRTLAVAAGVAFYALFAIFPAIAALVSTYGLFADPASMSAHLDVLANIAPAGAIEIIREQMTRLAKQGTATLGVGSVVGLGVSLWSANAGIKALFDALNIVYGEDEKRSFVKLNAVTLGCTVGAIVLLLIALAAVVGIPIALNFVGLAGVADRFIQLARWPLLIACISLATACIYRYGPSREMPRWRWISWGSAFVVIAWISASLLFSWYVGNFGSYNKTYGSLGAVIGFMTWIWISAVIMLVGAEIDAEIQRHPDGPDRSVVIGTQHVR